MAAGRKKEIARVGLYIALLWRCKFLLLLDGPFWTLAAKGRAIRFPWDT